jgi:hypothetical protein
MATVNLGSIKFKWKGTYAGGTAYTIDDVVSYNGSSYICIQASTGNLPTNATYFEQMSSAGTNGTDLTTTLTTQGDIVYRDASGLARLGAGTSGQVLQTNGTGANPSWTTMSSDMVLVSTTNYTASNVNSLDFTNVFTSTYRNYRIDINQYVPTSASYLNFQFKDSTGNLTNSNYVTGHGAENTGGTGGGGQSFDWNVGDINLTRFGGNDINTSIGNGGYCGTFNVYDPLNTNFNNVDILGQYHHVNGAGNRLVLAQIAGRHWSSGKAITGFRIYPHTGNINRVSVSIYGLKV